MGVNFYVRFKSTNNKQKKIRREIGSLLVIIILVCSGLSVIMPSNIKIPPIEAASTWTQDSYDCWPTCTIKIEFFE
jgi:hypothetical protein